MDGEVVALNESGRPSFKLLQNHRSSGAPVFYYVFDLIVLAGTNLANVPLDKRRELLTKRILPKLGKPIRFYPALDGSLPDVIASVRKHGLEGLVAKRRDSLYEAGVRTFDALVRRSTPGAGDRD